MCGNTWAAAHGTNIAVVFCGAGIWQTLYEFVIGLEEISIRVESTGFPAGPGPPGRALPRCSTPRGSPEQEMPLDAGQRPRGQLFGNIKSDPQAGRFQELLRGLGQVIDEPLDRVVRRIHGPDDLVDVADQDTAD